MSHDLVTVLGWSLIHFLWQGTLLGCAVAVLLTALRNASAQARYAVLCAGLVLALALPLLDIAQAWNGAMAGDAEPGAEGGLAALVMAGGSSMFAAVETHLHAIVLGWAACVTLLAARMALGLAWVGRAPHRGTPHAALQARVDRMADHFGIVRQVRLRVVADLAGPIAVGMWRPLVLVPAALLSGMEPAMLEALLAHELAHVKRHDYLVNLLQSVVEALLFYHPAVWWLSHRLRIERELVADDLAAKLTGEPRRLALALSELERVQFSNHHLAQAAQGGKLMNRIARLVRPEQQAMNWKAAILVFGLVLASLAFYAQAAGTATAGAATPGNATEPAFASLENCKPDYPAESLAKSEEGSVKVAFTINAQGKLIGSKVTSSSGHPLLDSATVTQLSKCEFRPAQRNGKPVTATLHAIYVWKLGD